MDDAATAQNILKEADHAADDAAREAREEVLRQAEERGLDLSSPKQSKRRAKRLATQSKSKGGWKHFIVDVWLWDLNPTEFGIFKRSRNRAKSRQFTSDMDIYAEVIEEGKRTGLIGYRKALWKKNSGADRRLVFKLFSDKLNWRGTMDLMLARSIQQTLGARLLPVTTYSINTAGDDQVVYIERSANKWPLLPENFSFFILRDKKLEFFRIKQDLIRIGDDYTVFNERNEKVAHIDGAFFTISGKWRVRVREEDANAQFMKVLKMFTGMLIFNNKCRAHIKTVAKHVRDGELIPKLEKQEIDLYMNPRRVR